MSRGDVTVVRMVIYSMSQLREKHSRRAIERLVREGALTRAGRWFVTPDEKDAIVLPLRSGCRPTCVTAARHHGLWTPASSRLHAYRPRAATLGSGWLAHGSHDRWPEPDPVASPALLLEHAARCLDPVEVGILADSALHLRRLEEADIATVARRAPRPVRRVLARVDRRAESGTESRVRLFFALKGVAVETQVQIGGVGRVDLRVGRSWIIECDSRAHHDDREAYAKDRRRDKAAGVLGYVTTRLTYEDVEDSWPTTRSQLLAILRTGEHLRPPTERARDRRRRR